MGALVAGLQNTDNDTGINLDSVNKYSSYWEQARLLYAPFECTTTMKRFLFPSKINHRFIY